MYFPRYQFHFLIFFFVIFQLRFHFESLIESFADCLFNILLHVVTEVSQLLINHYKFSRIVMRENLQNDLRVTNELIYVSLNPPLNHATRSTTHSLPISLIRSFSLFQIGLVPVNYNYLLRTSTLETQWQSVLVV